MGLEVEDRTAVVVAGEHEQDAHATESEHEQAAHATIPSRATKGELVEGVVEREGEWEEPVTEAWIEKLRGGEIDPGELTAGDRVRCVERLTQDGATVAEMSRMLRVCERTVARDRAEIRRRGVLEPTPTLADELLGELQRAAFDATQELNRIARNPGTNDYVRLWARSEAYKTQERFLQTAMKLGYLGGGTRRAGATVREEIEEWKVEEKKRAEAKEMERDLKFLETPMETFQSDFHLGCFRDALERCRCHLPPARYMRKLEAYIRRRKEVWPECMSEE